mmetsp:Transcript_3896/g.5080  ORF Transcript_3896/g.5080 Transcript_3896/m.5080 type:complete len:140 (-) Transcript_3896:14-433(-)
MRRVWDYNQRPEFAGFSKRPKTQNRWDNRDQDQSQGSQNQSRPNYYSLRNFISEYNDKKPLAFPKYDPRRGYNFINLSINSPRDWELCFKAKKYEEEIKKVIKKLDLSAQNEIHKQFSQEIVTTMEEQTRSLSHSLEKL